VLVSWPWPHKHRTRPLPRCTGLGLIFLRYKLRFVEAIGVILKSAISAYSAIDRHQAQKGKEGGTNYPDSAISREQETGSSGRVKVNCTR